MDIPPQTLDFFPTCRSLWASRDEGEEEASIQRIIHTRILQFFTPLQVTKLGLRLGQGYNKCGSQVELDWVQNFKVFAFLEDEWRLVLEQQNIPEPNGVVWLDFPPITTSALSVQVRKSGVDRWWPSWNVAMNGIAILAEPSGIPRPLPTRNLLIVEKEDAEIRAENLPDGVRMELFGSEVRYKTRFYEIGFLLQKAALIYFSLDEEGK
ncbi:MAG TPA: hypothetical protein VKK79_09650 [Candidatus Lokiarchaeia archaeon]|nr:hypothetical protein [Candidatus Lokiarchaeia archaeon]